MIRILLFNFLLAILARSTGIICHKVSDIIFVLDESESIEKNDFSVSKNFIATLISLLDVDVAKIMVRVGVVSYTARSVREIRIGDYIDKTDLTTKVQAITQRQGSTHTAHGLHTAWEELVWGLTNNNNRNPVLTPLASIHRVIMLFSDGLPTTGLPGDATKSQTVIIAQRIKDGQWSGMLPTTTSDADANLVAVNNSQLPYPVFIFSVHLPHLDADQAYSESLSSGVAFFAVLNQNQMIPPLALAAAEVIVRELCFTKAPTPSPTPAGSTPTKINIGGDIHFTTLDQVIFTFNAAGDYVYATSPDKFDLHVRAAMIGRATTLAAIAIRDHDSKTTTEVWWNGIGADEIVVNFRHNDDKNNTVIKLTDGSTDLGPFTMVNSDKTGTLELLHKKNPEFSVKCFYHGQASFDASIPKEWKTTGLGGNNNGNPDDDMCDRKARCLDLSESVTNRQVHNYGLDWKVLPDELVFERWMSVSNYELTYHPLVMTYEKLSKARQLCGKVQPCIFDFINVGTEVYAKLTKEKFSEKFVDKSNLYYYVGDRL